MLSTPGCRRHSAEVLILSADYPDRQSAVNNSRDRDGRSQAWPAPAGVLIMRKLTMAAAAAAAALILSGCEVVADSLIDAMFEDDYEYGYYDDDYDYGYNGPSCGGGYSHHHHHHRRGNGGSSNSNVNINNNNNIIYSGY